MSVFLSQTLSSLEAYIPGEQPQDKKYIKLNTNESPYAPCEGVLRVINSEAAKELRLYSDPTAYPLKKLLAEDCGVGAENVFVSNGSDEALNFAFMAYGSSGVVFPDITYGFYRVFAGLYHLDTKLIPLKDDFSIDPADFAASGRMVVLANPNAPTGRYLTPDDIEYVVNANRGNVVLIDEAYIDFGGTSVIPLTKMYDNLLVVQTFSKSRSLAGARVGYAIGNAALIEDLERIKYSTNPYNVNRLSMTAACEAVKDKAYYGRMCHKVVSVREYVSLELKALGFDLTESMANFVFVKKEGYDGKQLYLDLKKEGILVRHFNDGRIGEYNRITIGTEDQMKRFIEVAGRLIGNQLSIYT